MLFIELNITYDNYDKEGMEFLKDLATCINYKTEKKRFCKEYRDIKAKLEMDSFGNIKINKKQMDIQELDEFITDAIEFIEFLEFLNK